MLIARSIINDTVEFEHDGRMYRAIADEDGLVHGLEIDNGDGWRKVSCTSQRSIKACNANGFMVPE